MNKIIPYWYVIAICAVFFPEHAFAVGSGAFENASFSPNSIAQSNAVVAQADEPAAISYNPAGITQLRGLQIQSNAAFISVFTRRIHNDDINYSTGTVHVVPTAYLTINSGKFLNNRLVFGIGSDSPFGLGNSYDSNHSHVHYTGWNNWLKMFTIKPVVAIKFTDWLSIGAGPVYYRLFDFGTIFAYPNKLLQSPFGPIPGPPFLDYFSDGQVRADLSGNSWGWQIGALIKPHKKHQFGFYFRSPVTILTRGQIKVENATVGGNFETGAHGKLNLPLNITVGYAFKPNDRATIEMDFGFTRWESFKRLYINADHVNDADDAILAAIGKADKDYSNGFSLHLGGNYKINPKWTVRGGSLFFWTPVPNDHYIPAVPDSNSLAFSIGSSYELCKYLTVDLAYFQRLWLRRRIDNSISEPIGGTVDGKYFGTALEGFIGVTYKWESFLNPTEDIKNNSAEAKL